MNRGIEKKRRGARDAVVLRACTGVLAGILPKRRFELDTHPRRTLMGTVDGEILFKLREGRLRVPFKIKRGLNRAALAQMERYAQAGAMPGTKIKAPKMMLLADYVPPDLGDDTVKAGFAFVDTCGNADLRLGQEVLIQVRGNRPVAMPRVTGDPFGTPALLQVVFILLTDPEAENLPYREIANRAGTALGTVTNALRELRTAGLVRRTGGRTWRIEDRRTAIDQWVEGYARRLRQTLVLGCYRAAEDIHEEIAALIARPHMVVPGWGVTGPTAAEYMTDYYRAVELVLVLPPEAREIAKFMRWLPDRDGPITTMLAPTPAFARHRLGRNRVPVVHPLLVYAELMARGPGREQEVAEIIRKEHLE